MGCDKDIQLAAISRGIFRTFLKTTLSEATLRRDTMSLTDIRRA